MNLSLNIFIWIQIIFVVFLSFRNSSVIFIFIRDIFSYKTYLLLNTWEIKREAWWPKPSVLSRREAGVHLSLQQAGSQQSHLCPRPRWDAVAPGRCLCTTLWGSPVRLPYLPALSIPVLSFPESSEERSFIHNQLGLILFLCHIMDKLQLCSFHCPYFSFLIGMIDPMRSSPQRQHALYRGAWENSISWYGQHTLEYTSSPSAWAPLRPRRAHCSLKIVSCTNNDQCIFSFCDSKWTKKQKHPCIGGELDTVFP
jgi:hypothetical protein